MPQYPNPAGPAARDMPAIHVDVIDWFKHIMEAMSAVGNPRNVCVYSRTSEDGFMSTVRLVEQPDGVQSIEQVLGMMDYIPPRLRGGNGAGAKEGEVAHGHEEARPAAATHHEGNKLPGGRKHDGGFRTLREGIANRQKYPTSKMRRLRKQGRAKNQARKDAKKAA